MARGFSSGVLWGGVIGLGLTTAASVLVPLPSSPVVSDAAPEAAAAPARVEQASSGEGGSQSDRTLITGQVTPQTLVPEDDAAPALDTDTLKPTGQPQAGLATELGAPAAAIESAALDVAGEAPVLPNPLALAPMDPQPADELAISTEPAAPPAPSTQKVEGSFDAPAQLQPVGVAEDVVGEVVTAGSGGVASPQAPEVLQAPEADSDTQTLAASTVPAPPTEAAQIAAITEELQVTPLDPPITVVTREDVRPTQDPAPLQEPQADTAQTEPVQIETEGAQVTADGTESDPAQDAPIETAQTDTVQTEAVQAEPAATETEQTETAQVESIQTETAQAQTETETAQAEQPATTDSVRQAQTGAATPVVVRRIGTPSVTLTDRDTGVTINRLTNVDAEPEAPEVPVVPVTEDAIDSDLPPVKRFAQDFENPEQKPLMSIVLIDDGTSEVAGAKGISALSSFPYALSFAVDASLQDAADRMAIYRAAGFEVMAMIDLPQGAQPRDAETTLGVLLPVMNEVVGVLEGTAGGLQGARPVADQVTAILAQTGHGLVTQDKGLNTMPKLARKASVPADPVFRDFDGNGQNAQVIRRFLDQAAFKAGQEGAVVMLGRMRPDTISALLLWGLQDRAGKVALAPISALLTRDQ